MGEENEREAGIGERRSKDKKANKEGLKLLKLLEETGLVIWNGNVEGDREGEFTFAGERGARSLCNRRGRGCKEVKKDDRR